MAKLYEWSEIVAENPKDSSVSIDS